jgi:hypothetical protein
MGKGPYRVGDTVWLTIRKGRLPGEIKHISTNSGVPAPFVVEYRDENNNLRTHNATKRELEPR